MQVGKRADIRTEDVMQEGTMPATANPLLEIAWHDFVMWCYDQKEYTDAFEKDTGQKLIGRNFIEQLIDQQTGAENELFFSFARYITEKVWGMEYAPPAFREECERRDREKEKNSITYGVFKP